MGKKVVLDTNILISALGWKGKPREVFQKCINGELDLVISKEQIKELKRVMDYPKFTFSEEQKETFLSIILEFATLVKISSKLKIIKDDPDDDAILETGLVGDVDYIISGDPHLLKLNEFNNIKIVKVSEFLENVSTSVDHTPRNLE
tara:strand:- start:47 stop:487 length:441 start_codon:yes stop_codon:yes gene_type:complete